MADIAEQLKDALDKTVKGGRTLYAVAVAAKLKPEMVYGFARGDRDLRHREESQLRWIKRMQGARRLRREAGRLGSLKNPGLKPESDR